MRPRITWWAIALVGISLGIVAGARASAEDRSAPPVAAPDAAPAPMPESAPARKPLTLDRAVEAGLLEVRGISPTSYTTVLLVLANRSQEELLLDVSGRHLEPTTGGVQRLGLSFPTTPSMTGFPAEPGTSLVTLAPGERREIRMSSCCIDAGLPCPRTGDKYVLGKTATPPSVEMSLRWWVDHPQAPQGFVNAAIWQHNPNLLDSVPSNQDAPANWGWPKGKSVRSYRGMLYLLDDGALTSVDSEGVRRFHATGIYQVFPESGGLLAVGHGREGRELWRFGATGDPPWSKLFSVGDLGIRALVAPSNGSFLVLERDDLSFRGTKQAPGSEIDLRTRDGSKTRGLELGVLDSAKGRVLAFAWREGTPRGGPLSGGNVQERSPTLDLYDVDGRTGTAKLRRTFWNARHFAAGPAGAYALSPNGGLERLDGEHLSRIPSDHEWTRVRAVGSKRLLLQAEGDALFAYDLKSGRSTPLPAGADDVTIDPVTDDLVWTLGDAALRWSPGLAEPERIPFN